MKPIAALAVACAMTLSAQTASVLEGFVFDPAGAVVGGAAVEIWEQGTNLVRGLETDQFGRYEAQGLPPGLYRVSVVRTGFLTETRGDLRIGAGRTLRLDFHLALGRTSERIFVSGRTPLVSAATGDWGNTVGKEKLDSLPLNGRDLYDLAAQEAGASVPSTALTGMNYGGGTHLSVNGARPMQSAFRMDGIYINDSTGSSPASATGSLLGVEGIEEVRMITSPFSAEYGRTVGGVLTAVSRSGTNQLHGSAYDFLRNSALDAKNYFDDPAESITPLRRNQFGGMLSGPLVRDRLFVLGNYEAIRRTSGLTVRPLTITEAARQRPVAEEIRPYLDLFPLPNGRDYGDGSAEFVSQVVRQDREDYGGLKLDLLATDGLRLSARYTFDDAVSTEPEQFYIWNLTSNSRYQFLNTEAVWVASAATVHTFRAGFSRVGNADSAAALRSIPEALWFVPGTSMGSITVSGLYELGEGRYRQRPRRQITNDYQWNWDVSAVRGKHTWRAGAGLTRSQFNQRSDFNASGRYRFLSIGALLSGDASQAELMAPGADTVRGWRQAIYFGYVQDEVKLPGRIQLTMGMRYEGYTTPVEVNGKVSTIPDPARDAAVTVGGALFRNPSARNFAPRGAVAWDPTGSGKTVVRAGAGLFFDLIGYREIQLAGVRMPPFYEALRLTDPAFPRLSAVVEQSDTPLVLEALDYGAEQPYVIQFQAAIQHEFSPGTAGEVGYSGSRGIHLSGRVASMNPPVPAFLPDGRVYFAPDAARINPAFDQIGLRRTQFNSFYHAMNVSFQRELAGGVRFQARYTWSKSIDENSSPSNAEFLQSDRMPHVFDYRANRGPSDFDIRQVLTVNGSWRVPSSGMGGAAGRLLDGWEVHGMLRAQTGPHFSPFLGIDRAGLSGGNGGGSGQRPDLIGGDAMELVLGDPAQWFNPLAFGLPDAGFLGNLGRNTLEGPGLAMLDVALHKVLWSTERQKVTLRVEGFNLINRPNFQIPSALDLFNGSGRIASAGRITQTTTSPRQVQIALKWSF